MGSKKNSSPYSGQCLCGSLKYKVDEIGLKMGTAMVQCAGSFMVQPLLSLVKLSQNNFRWTQGGGQLKTFTASNGTQRQFCANCGSSLIFIPSNGTGERVEFALGTFDSPIDLKPDTHIFVQHKLAGMTSGMNYRSTMKIVVERYTVRVLLMLQL